MWYLGCRFFPKALPEDFREGGWIMRMDACMDGGQDGSNACWLLRCSTHFRDTRFTIKNLSAEQHKFVQFPIHQSASHRARVASNPCSARTYRWSGRRLRITWKLHQSGMPYCKRFPGISKKHITLCADPTHPDVSCSIYTPFIHAQLNPEPLTRQFV